MVLLFIEELMRKFNCYGTFFINYITRKSHNSLYYTTEMFKFMAVFYVMPDSKASAARNILS